MRPHGSAGCRSSPRRRCRWARPRGVAAAVLLTWRDGLSHARRACCCWPGSRHCPISSTTIWRSWPRRSRSHCLAADRASAPTAGRSCPPSGRPVVARPGARIPFGVNQWPVINLVVAGVLAIGLVTNGDAAGSALRQLSARLVAQAALDYEEPPRAANAGASRRRPVEPDEKRGSPPNTRETSCAVRMNDSPLRGEAVVGVADARSTLPDAICSWMPAADLVPFAQVALRERLPEVFGRQGRLRVPQAATA